MATERKIALLGQPNSGKSTVFNALTGAHQHVGNWPGKTVEKKEGRFTFCGSTYLVADLPGSYSLSANSDEEIITRDYIASGGVDMVCILADASQLERSLFMLADYAGINTPAMLVLTMIDVARQQGKNIDTKRLSEKLGIPVVDVVATDKKQYTEFYRTLERALQNPKNLNADALYQLYMEGDKANLFKKAVTMVPEGGIDQYSANWLASKVMEGDEVAARKVSAVTSREAVDTFLSAVKDGSLYTGDCKFAWISTLLNGTVSKPRDRSKILTKFDKAAISKRWGKWIAVGITILGLAASMVLAMPIMAAGSAVPTLLTPLFQMLADGGVASWLVNFLNGTLVNAISFTISMLGFVFGINFVFGLIEELGYMARVSYVFDHTMGKLGLQGKSIMPMLVGFGCTIGGAASTRVIDSWGQRLLTIALVWAVPCAATFAVIPTVATAFFGWGGILVMIGIFALMFVHIMITAKVFGRKLSPKEERTGLIMELPPYHKPRWSALLKNTLLKVWSVFKKAFIVVFLVAAVFWILSYSSSGLAQDSVIYKIGIVIEPFTRIFGMSWQMFAAFLASMVSKEAVLGVLSALFTGTGGLFEATIGSVAADANVMQAMVANISKPEALAFIMAVTFNVPCIVALASTYYETHSVKWTLRIALYYIASALVIAFAVYHVASLFF